MFAFVVLDLVLQY